MEEKDAHKGKRTPWMLREFGGKTIWDWLQLLIVPVVLSLITVAFALWQDARQQEIENKRARAERELAEQRAQDEALQAYLDKMSTLLLEEKDLKSDRVRTLMRARTITVLETLDPSRKTRVLQFLEEAELVQKVEVGGRGPLITLATANLRDANLRDATWSYADLSDANLRDTDLIGADVSHADLRDADLRDANVRGAFLSFSDLTGANLDGANLRSANLSDADLIGADLRDANLRDAFLFEADLRVADLRGADLSHARLFNAELRNADLRDANVRDADLDGADLSGATSITNEELKQQAKSLEGTTMPNGQKYEDWLKSRDPGEDG